MSAKRKKSKQPYWSQWVVGNTVRYIGSGEGGVDCHAGMTVGAEYLIHEEPDTQETMLVLDNDGDEISVLIGEFEWVKP